MLTKLCVFSAKHTNEIIVIFVYVDDMLPVSNLEFEILRRLNIA